MDDTRPIQYGVVDYAQIRKKNAWFVDRTAKIRWRPVRVFHGGDCVLAEEV
jgi:hypothetical protein